MISLLQRWYQRHFSQPGTIEFALVLLGAFLIVYYLMWLVGPIVVALCLAFCLDWPTESLCNKFRLGRHLASIIVMIIFCSLVVFITVLIVPNVIKQGAEFYNSIISFSLETPNHNKAAEQIHLGADPVVEVESESPTAAGSAPQNQIVPAAAAPMATTAQRAALRHAQVPSAETKIAAKAETEESAPTLTTKAPALIVAENTPAAMSTQAPASAPMTSGTATLTAPATSQDHPTSAHTLATDNADDVTTAAALAALEAQMAERSVKAISGNEQTANAVTKERLERVATTGGPSFVQNLEVNREASAFTLTVRDFDLRIARELNDIVVRLPEPLPSMVTLDLLERTVRSLRVGATNQIANLMRTQLMPSVVNAFTWLVYLIVVPIFTFLMLYNKHELQKTARQFLLPNNQELMRKFWPSMHQQIAGYIRGKLLHIIIISIANTFAFMVMGVNYALLLGVGVGLSVVIPYVGAVIIAVPVILVAIFQFGFSSALMWVLVIYTVIQLLDSNILTPMLFAKAMSLDAFSILAAIMIFGGLWGFWGVFFAIPLATFIKTLITRWPNADLEPTPAALPAAQVSTPPDTTPPTAPKAPPKERI